ncbi:MAG TPA: FxsA family protein [Humibacillus xanthopallidus]|nr:FxsA family protein [Humibacillus xanthopallidus]
MTTAPGARRRRLRPTRVAAAALLLVPILEIMVMIAVGQAIGGWWTFLLVIATSALGAWIVTREGGRAWRALGQALREGRMPARELADGIVVLVGGTLLLIPGFITDVAGLLLVLPFTRPVARALLASVIGRHLVAQVEVFGATTVTDRPTWEQQETPHGAQRSESSSEVVEGEIIDED